MEISNKKICWVDPITNEFLETKNHFLVSKSSSYSILDGIPNFVNTVNDKMQKQVQESFGEKWTQNDFGQDDTEFEEKIKPIYLEMMGLEESDLDIFNNKTILVLDPMLATGNSSSAAIDLIKERGVKVKNIKLISLLAAPEGIKNIRKNHKDLHIFTCSLDKGLNKKKYIVPGLGDAGDRYMGT